MSDLILHYCFGSVICPCIILEGPTVKTVFIVTVDQEKVEVGERLRVLLSAESRLSVYDATDGKLENLLTNADAILLVCSENIESLLSSKSKVKLMIEDTEVQIDCEILQKFIENGKDKEKFIVVGVDDSHFPAALKSNFSYIYPDDKAINESNFLKTVRPQIESL